MNHQAGCSVGCFECLGVSTLMETHVLKTKSIPGNWEKYFMIFYVYLFEGREGIKVNQGDVTKTAHIYPNFWEISEPTIFYVYFFGGTWGLKVDDGKKETCETKWIPFYGTQKCKHMKKQTQIYCCWDKVAETSNPSKTRKDLIRSLGSTVSSPIIGVKPRTA